MDNHTDIDNAIFLTQDDCGWDCEFTFVRANESEGFHNKLFSRYKPLGLTGYEQDFM
eukprot:gene2275-3135_t